MEDPQKSSRRDGIPDDLALVFVPDAERDPGLVPRLKAQGKRISYFGPGADELNAPPAPRGQWALELLLIAGASIITAGLAAVLFWILS